MQDKAIAQIGHWQLEQNRDLDPVDLYIENMFPGKDYQMLLMFEITSDNGDLSCANNSVCSVTSAVADDIYGFAAPFKYSSPDKPGFIS